AIVLGCCKVAPMAFPVVASQRWPVPFRQPVKTVRPSGLKAATTTPSLCGSIGPIRFPLTTSQKQAIPPSRLVRTILPSGLKAAHRIWLLVSSGVPTSVPVATFHKWAGFSEPPASRVRQSELRANGPVSVKGLINEGASGLPVVASQRRAVPSQLTVP